MKYELKTNRITSLPVQVIGVENGVVIKRGSSEFHVEGEGAEELVERILAATSGKVVVREDLGQLFSGPDQPRVEELIQQLVDRRMMVEGEDAEAVAGKEHGESQGEVYYWNFDRKKNEVEDLFSEWRISILGVNAISRRLVAALAESGYRDPLVVDCSHFRNITLFGSEQELKTDAWPQDIAQPQGYDEWQENFDFSDKNCLVVTSDFGGIQRLQEWNRFSIENDVHFFPVVLQNLIGYLGPLVVPNETPCFECLLARQNSNREHPELSRAVEEAAFQGQTTVGWHPTIAAMLGDLAAMELLKFYGGRLPSWHVGTVLELHVMVPTLISRRLLRVPRCPACSSLNTQSSSAAEKFVLRGPGLDDG